MSSIQINPRLVAKHNAVDIYQYVTAPVGTLVSMGKGWLHLITEEGLACDCGKDLYCPLHLAFRLRRDEGYHPSRGYALTGIREIAGVYETRRQALDAVSAYYAELSAEVAAGE